MGINVKTVHDYLYYSRHLNYLVKTNDGHWQFKSLKVIIPNLIQITTYKERNFFRHVNFFTGADYSKELKLGNSLFKCIYHRIQQNILLTKYKQQKYVNDFLLDAGELLKTDKRQKGKILKQAEKMLGKISYYELRKKIVSAKREIQSGKYHVANIIGCSPATAAKRLNQWSCFLFERTIKKVVVDSNTSKWYFDFIKGLKNAHVRPYNNGYIAVFGSAIELIDTPLIPPCLCNSSRVFIRS